MPEQQPPLPKSKIGCTSDYAATSQVTIYGCSTKGDPTSGPQPGVVIPGMGPSPFKDNAATSLAVTRLGNLKAGMRRDPSPGAISHELG
jgi:hypothetical protein